MKLRALSGRNNNQSLRLDGGRPCAEGEKVTLTVERGALTITVDTIAIEDGKMGEQVELTNAESGKVIRGIVIGRHQAKGIAP